ncbi:unnamed protein product [Owenia fusiformis]|uniref:Uncharacterized protein n=1 Tax=Owenia fusiformis TaxID=6347 RepID=A0A8S4NTH5_OWEFU|nr:unnamed protein product [Owenia fusiformis]
MKTPKMKAKKENMNSNKSVSEKEEDSSIKSILSTFALSTTAHGCSRIDQSRSVSAKLIWMAIFVACLFGATVCIISLLEKYFQFPTKDVVEVADDPISFPSVSFCSLNPYPSSYRSKIAKMKPENRFLEVYSTLGNFEAHVLNKSFPLYDRMFPNHHNIKSYKWMYDNAPNEDEALSIGHDLEDILLSCSIAGDDCNISQIESFINPYFFKCYTMNPKDFNDSSVEPLVHSTGAVNGLSALFFLDIGTAKRIYNPTSPLGGSSGLLVVIHPPGTQPDPLQNGFNIAPGFSTSVELQNKNRELLGHPWGDCENREKLSDFPYKYDKSSCERQCQQKFIMDQCGCVTSIQPIPDNLKNMSMCGKMDLKNLNSDSPNISQIAEEIDKLECEHAKKRVLKKDYPTENKCDCPRACHNTIYDYTISQCEWPSEGVMLDFYKHAITLRDMQGSGYLHSTMYNLLDSKVNSNNTKENRANQEMIRKNFLRLNVFFSSLNTEITKQVVEYTFTDLISGVGGGFGVYVGFSIVTICEFCVLFAHLVKAMMNYRKNAVNDEPWAFKRKSMDIPSSK